MKFTQDKRGKRSTFSTKIKKKRARDIYTQSSFRSPSPSPPSSVNEEEEERHLSLGLILSVSNDVGTIL